MKFEEVANLIDGIPYTSTERGRELYDFVLKNKPFHVLELGVAHGVTMCYVAAALDELGRGLIEGVDLAGVVRDPCPEALLERCGLGNYGRVYKEQTSYTWFLKRKIEMRTTSNVCEPVYDFCFVDGPKNWTIDGAAFFMVDKLLRPNGTILFDDYSYSYGSEAGATDGINHRELSDAERLEPHVRAIFHLLVMQHESYGDFQVINEQWAWARKTGGTNRALKVTEKFGAKEKLLRIMRRLRRAGITN